MNRFCKSEQGFTLVELLVVVAIIGILAAIAIPQFTKYKRNAAVAQCNADLKNCMAEAAARYAHNTSDNKKPCVLPGNAFNSTPAMSAARFEVNATTGEIILREGTAPNPGEWSGIKVKYAIDKNRANCTLPN